MTRFFSECDHCDQLLADYVSAGNKIVDVKNLVQTHNGFAGLAMASIEIRDARKRKRDVLKRFLMHKKREHGLDVKTRARD